MNLRHYMTKDYENKSGLLTMEKQTQTNPTCSERVEPTCSERACTEQACPERGRGSRSVEPTRSELACTERGRSVEPTCSELVEPILSASGGQVGGACPTLHFFCVTAGRFRFYQHSFQSGSGNSEGATKPWKCAVLLVGI